MKLKCIGKTYAFPPCCNRQTTDSPPSLSLLGSPFTFEKKDALYVYGCIKMWSLHVLLVFSEPNDCMGGRINNILNSPQSYFGGVALLVG